MTTITIDDQRYSFDQLSEEAKTQLLNFQATETEIQRLTVQLGIAQTARSAYANALKAALPSPLELMSDGGSLKLE